jgi:hypothetical protein
LEDNAMTASRDQLENLVVRMQQDFLENPRLTLTLADALKRFGAEEATCEAVLGALVDATVLARTPEGVYVRYFPRLVVSHDVPTSGPRDQRGGPKHDRPRRFAKHAA